MYGDVCWIAGGWRGSLDGGEVVVEPWPIRDAGRDMVPAWV